MKNYLFLFVLFLGITQMSCSQIKDYKKMVSSNNSFAFKMFDQLRSPEKNMFFSPYSISTALSMTYAGAKGETEKQMSEVLNFEENKKDFHENYGYFQEKIAELNSTNGIELKLANKIWLQKNYSIQEKFGKTMKKNYSAPIEKADFKNPKERKSAREDINLWVSKVTEKKIPELIPENFFTEQTRMVLVNAIYFAGNWKYSFNEKMTRQLPFYRGKEQQRLEFMQTETKFKYLEQKEFQVLEMPYKDDKMSMLVFLPSFKINMKEFYEMFTPEFYNKAISQMKETKVLVRIPKFELSEEYELEKVLPKMGMADAFSRKADFSAMSKTKDLKIDKVIHKSFIEINEKGTEAAAATAVSMGRKNGGVKKLVFNANRPFLFLIKENKNNTILFFGQMTEGKTKSKDKKKN